MPEQESFLDELFGRAIDEGGVLGDVLLDGDDTQKFYDPDEPRDGSGKWAKGGTKKVPHRPTKEVTRFSRLRDPARRRRALAGLKRERELAEAIGGVNLPDSEPADVVYAEFADGKRAETHEHVKTILAHRETAVQTLKDRNAHPERRADAERALSAPLHFFEAKTLLTSKKSTVHMSKGAVARKQRWSNRYGAAFHTVAVDDRKGQKHSGHRVHVAAETLGGSLHLKDMHRAESMAGVLQHLRDTQRFAEPHGGEFAKGGGRVPGKGEHGGGGESSRVDRDPETPHTTGRLPDGREVRFVPHEKQRPDETTVMIDPRKWEEDWKKDSMHLPPEGSPGASEIKGRREGFKRFLDSGKPVQASRGGLDPSGDPYFEDGRHRFAVLRDLGIDRVAVTVPRKQAAKITERYGAD